MRVVVVIPAFRVEKEIGAVLATIPGFVKQIVVVNDQSPDRTADRVIAAARKDPRIELITHASNQGVGGAMITGFRRALELDAAVVVKVDGDGQMPPQRISELLAPLVDGQADLAKGNRFLHLESLTTMPLIRRLGNAALSFMVKAASGYWHCFDPANGFFAIRGDLLRELRLDRLDRSYFFEISLLCELYLHNAVVRDVPMPAEYGSETSGVSILRVLVEFPPKLLLRLVGRMLRKYFLHEFSLVSIYLLAGLPMLLFGLIFGFYEWIRYAGLGRAAPTGTVMLATLPVILGFQLLLAATGLDVQNVPKEPRTAPL